MHVFCSFWWFLDYRLAATSMCTIADSVDLCSSNSGVTSGNCTAGRILVELNFLRMLAYALPNSQLVGASADSYYIRHIILTAHPS